MKTTSDRIELQQALDDGTTTLLLLFGESPLVDKLHAKAEAIGLDADWRTFWISDPGILSDDEKKDWYRDDTQYTTLSMPNDENKRGAKMGSLGSLCQSTGEPSAFELRNVFTAAEA